MGEESYSNEFSFVSELTKQGWLRTKRVQVRVWLADGQESTSMPKNKKSYCHRANWQMTV